ncbi:DUF3800 domain-containing protein [Spirilliplanes yamanashiensis]|uniref:DUF3800 domain-containing protein n=1 Tax=Spirilliplanes yamanashiensis TaxID=42233 RepID=A0A8J3YCM0_9ACTN|nr:DUF3800 domain-containing protein [Spirilliplanes yamanashiensis]MDP9816581.1 hypothetical protein [Spirilliplanes yamanashiensis]GIJ06108.1 hypothetical protein Sya03_54600 [Spirilliplanes yamanashiensis]
MAEIACDESGYEGEKLAGTSTPYFGHASVRLTSAAAAACVAELRRRIRSPATEYKANHLLREKHRRVLVWVLGPDGPLLGHARVHLVDKIHLLRVRLAAVLGVPPAAFAEPVLAAGNALLRTRAPATAVDDFFRLAPQLAAARPAAEAYRAALRTRPAWHLELDPLIDAVGRLPALWGPGITVAHDRQNVLSPDRLAALAATPGIAAIHLVDTDDDPRIQLADILAGTACRIAATGDAELRELLRPYVGGQPVPAR